MPDVVGSPSPRADIYSIENSENAGPTLAMIIKRLLLYAYMEQSQRHKFTIHQECARLRCVFFAPMMQGGCPHGSYRCVIHGSEKGLRKPSFRIVVDYAGKEKLGFADQRT